MTDINNLIAALGQLVQSQQQLTQTLGQQQQGTPQNTGAAPPKISEK
ncbi:1543_t:CDS:2 [Entrophospora sp. SA101]|nr:2956_t:CDS:2 [Entrophospora sp. SA101]CAJ0758550.1 1543_t:CDS:2 [Entrophospora sp. SA101]